MADWNSVMGMFGAQRWVILGFSGLCVAVKSYCGVESIRLCSARDAASDS